MTTLDMTPSLFSVEGMAGVVFWVIICMTIAGGGVVAMAKGIVHAVAGLILCFVGVAGLYFYLNSPFLSMMQILIYVGAVAIAISFAIMLAAPEEKLNTSRRSRIAGVPAMLTCAVLAGSFVMLATGYEWSAYDRVETDGSLALFSMERIGLALLTEYSMVFELVSIVLLVAILGALIIARVPATTRKKGETA